MNKDIAVKIDEILDLEKCMEEDSRYIKLATEKYIQSVKGILDKALKDEKITKSIREVILMRIENIPSLMEGITNEVKSELSRTQLEIEEEDKINY